MRTYEQFILDLDTNRYFFPFLLEQINGMLREFLLHYDDGLNHGRIAPTDKATYELVLGRRGDEQIKNNICGPAHQWMVNRLNEAGIPARTFFAGEGSWSEKQFKASHNLTERYRDHYGLLYSPQQGEWVANNYDQSVLFKADNMIEAAEMAGVLNPLLIDTGIVMLMSEKGDKIAYSKFALGRLLRHDPDINSPDSLNHFFSALRWKEGTGTRTLLGPDLGTDPIHGDYQAAQVTLDKKNADPIGQGAMFKTDLEFNYAFIHNEITPEKGSETHVFSARADTLLVSPELQPGFPLKVFLGATLEIIASATDGTTKDGNEINRSKIAWGDLALSQVAGSTIKFGEQYATEVSYYGGLRGRATAGVYDLNLGLRPEFITGAEIKNTARIKLKDDQSLKLTQKISDVAVIAPDYRLNTVNFWGEAGITRNAVTASVFLGWNYEIISLNGLEATGISKRSNTEVGGKLTKGPVSGALGLTFSNLPYRNTAVMATVGLTI